MGSVEMIQLEELQTEAWQFCQRRRRKKTEQLRTDQQKGLMEPVWVGCDAEWDLWFARVCEDWTGWL